MDLINFRESDKKIKMPYRVLFKKNPFKSGASGMLIFKTCSPCLEVQRHDSYRQEGALKTWVNPLLHKYHTNPLELFCNFRWKIIKLF